MTIVLVEGFDHFSADDANEKFWNGFVPGFVRMDTGRDPIGQCIVIQTLATMTRQLPSNYSTLICGFSVKFSGIPTHFFSFVSTSAGTVAALGVSGGFLTLTDNAANTFSGTTLIPDGSWFQVEVKVALSGAFEVRLNGVTEISGSGSFGSDNILKLLFTHTGFSEGATTRVDDVYVVDTTGGSPLNTFLGDVEVLTLYPTADGHYGAWTPLIAGNHFVMVNEKDMDGDGSYIYDANIGDRDSFVMDPVGVSDTIYALQVNVAARKGDAGIRQIAPFIRQSATDHDGSTVTLSLDWLFYSWLLAQDPTSVDWTPSTVNGDEYGVKVVA